MKSVNPFHNVPAAPYALFGTMALAPEGAFLKASVPTVGGIDGSKV
jgi:hypothetical protein